MMVSGWWLNGGGIPLVSLAHTGPVVSVLGAVGVCTLLALVLMIVEGRWSWRPTRGGTLVRQLRLVVSKPHVWADAHR